MVKSTHGFKVLSSISEYENPYFKAIRYQVERPNGVRKPFWTVSKYDDFSVIIPIFPDGNTILVGQYRISVRFYSWEFPMGQVRGKSPLQMAKQELIEETGIRAKVFKKIGNYHLASGLIDQEVHVYIARDLEEGKSEPEEDEFIKIRKVKAREVGKMIDSGMIKDGPTIVAFHFLEKYI